MGSKKKRNCSAGVAKSLKGNRAIASSAPKFSRRVGPAEYPRRPAIANNNGEFTPRTGQALSESRIEEVPNDKNNNILKKTPTNYTLRVAGCCFCVFT